MTDMFSMPFEYNLQSYSALVATKENAEGREYRITIMNGELEQLLYGYHIFSLRKGTIQPENISTDATVFGLQKVLMAALASMEQSFAQV